LAEFEEFQVRIQFREDPEVAKKISDSLKDTTVSRRTRVGHITGIPEASSDLTSLVSRVQEKLPEEVIHSIHTKSAVKATKTDQEVDFASEHKNLAQEVNDHKHEVAPVSRNFVPDIRLTPPLGSRKRSVSVSSVSPRINLSRSPLRLQRSSRTTRLLLHCYE
jgi:hypothetical protein